MNLKERIENVENLKEAIICISFGTFVGILTYYIFLYFHIDIYGWNFGLIFAPLAAGYAETILAKRIIGEDIGAISAFILFLVTVVYYSQSYTWSKCNHFRINNCNFTGSSSHTY